MKRILILLSSLAMGGAERVTVSFLRRLASSQKDFTAILCTVTARHDSPLADELSDSGIMRKDLQACRLADPFALLRFVHLLRVEKIDLIHAHGQDASILAAAIRLFLRVPLIVTRHVLDEPVSNWRQRLRCIFALKAIQSADAVVAVSSSVANRLKELKTLPRTGVNIIPNGIVLDKFDRPDLVESRDKLRVAFGFSLDDRLVLLPAVLREGKGHEMLIAALPSIRARIPAARIVFVGDGPNEAMFRAQAKPQGDAIVFLGQRMDIPELLAISDVVVLPSCAEALPTILIEAAAARRPVVATRVGGSEQIVEHNKSGILIPPNDPEQLSDSIVRLLKDYHLAKSFGETAHKIALQCFSIDLQISRTTALWKEVLLNSRK